MKVLVLTENPAHDQFIVRPVIERIFDDLARSARIEILQDGRLDGCTTAFARNTVADIVSENPMVDLFLLVGDRDCDRQTNTEKLTAREQEHAGRLIACLAREEVETWLLGVHRGASDFPAEWRRVREDCDPKEAFAEPLIKSRGWSGGVGGGRKRAMRDLGREWRGLTEVCDEIGQLRSRVRAWLESRA